MTTWRPSAHQRGEKARPSAEAEPEVPCRCPQKPRFLSWPHLVLQLETPMCILCVMLYPARHCGELQQCHKRRNASSYRSLAGQRVRGRCRRARDVAPRGEASAPLPARLPLPEFQSFRGTAGSYSLPKTTARRLSTETMNLVIFHESCSLNPHYI